MTQTRVLPLVLAALVLMGAGCLPADTQAPPAAVPPAPAPQAVIPSPIPPVDRTFPGKLADAEIKNKQIRITTAHGDIVFELFADTAPLTVSNFVALAKDGYYDGLTFHRREERFVIQGGDPRGNGTGGPGYQFEDELNDTHGYDRGIVAMANAGPNTNGSQFFIMLANVPLPKSYSIFGRVLSGLEAVDKVNVGDVMSKVTVEELKK